MLKNIKVFQLGECQSLESWAVLVQSDGSYSTLSPVLHGDIVPSVNTIQRALRHSTTSFSIQGQKRIL